MMSTAASQHKQPFDARVVDTQAVDGQREHWGATFEANPDMYGTDPSASGLATAEAFAAAGHGSVLELGAGQGRDTLFLARQGLHVTALDFAPGTVETLTSAAQAAGLGRGGQGGLHSLDTAYPRGYNNDAASQE